MSKITYTIPIDRLISKQVKLWESMYDRGAVESGQAVLPTITISKEIGSLGVELADRLAKRLQWQVYDKNLVEHIANDAQVRKHVVESFDEKTQSEFETWLHTLLDRHALASDKYFKHLLIVMLSIAEHGSAIILGRGGNFILSPQTALRLKTVAPKGMRVEYIVKHEKLDTKRANQRVSEADKERRAFIRRFFHHDVEDPLCYDLILNMGCLQLTEAEEIVVHALKSKFRNLRF